LRAIPPGFVGEGSPCENLPGGWKVIHRLLIKL
jgi:hypothetical protein